MSYKVIKDFTDLKDHNHVYHVGDSYPRHGVKVSDERVAELASVKNKRGEVLIKAESGTRRTKISPVTDEKSKDEVVVTRLKKKSEKRNKKEK